MGWFRGGEAADETLHPCAGAGRWFPADPVELRDAVSHYLQTPDTAKPKGQPEAIIVPHAGYVYCGPVAGTAFEVLRERKDIRRVFILAFSHSYPIRGVSVLDVDAYETPLGDVPVDRAVVETLLKNPLFTTVARAHATEHSDENELPFLQVALGKDFKIVSLYVGQLKGKEFDVVAAAIRPFLNEHTVLVASSDFTHYGEAYGFDPFHGVDVKDRMRKLDRGAIDRICGKDFTGFRDYVHSTGATICGVQPISLLLKVLPADAKGHLLQYRTSADTSGGDYSLAVGYAAIAFTEDRATTKTAKSAEAAEKKTDAAAPEDGASSTGSGSAAARSSVNTNPEGPATELQNLDIVTPEEQRTLLRLARKTLEKSFESDPPAVPEGTEPSDLGDFQITDTLKKRYGAFVTLTIHGDLRGCIGYIVGREPLYKAVMQNALNAAFNDPRFPPLTHEECKNVHIEISVLSPLENVRPEEVVVGRDGLLITRDGRSGVLLPQVPVEQGWNRTQFLDYLCRKAGLPKGSWREGATLQRFGAQVFGEEKPGHVPAARGTGH